MFIKDMEIPNIFIKLKENEFKFENCELNIVPERLKRRVKLDKEYKLREKIGSISIELGGKEAEEEEEEEFDDIEQVYLRRESQCKYKFMYGTQDFKEFNILKLNGKNRILIEIPDFKNYLMYNLLCIKILEELNPSKIVLFVEETESVNNSGKKNEQNKKMMDDFLNGRFRGSGGELGFGGIVASFLNRVAVENVSLSVVEKSKETMKTLYV